MTGFLELLRNNAEAALELPQLWVVPSLLDVATTWALVGAALVPMEQLWPAHPEQRKSRRSAALDLAYCALTPTATRLFTNFLLAALAVLLMSIRGLRIGPQVFSGFGPLAAQPLLVQALEILLAADFIDYWTHRTFHSSRFWKIHAVHHSPQQMDWLASSRMHPLNDATTRIFQIIPLTLCGFAPQAIVSVVPYIVFYVIFLHSNVRFAFGPLRYVLVSPAYHRWHHASDTAALDRNFAGIFPLWDVLFGTLYLPRTLPQRYGVTKEPPPETLHGQLLYPFRSRKPITRPVGEDRGYSAPLRTADL